MLDPETIIAIETIVNRLLDDREAQKAERYQRTAEAVKGRLSALLQEAASDDTQKRFDQHWENATRREQERSTVPQRVTLHPGS